MHRSWFFAATAYLRAVEPTAPMAFRCGGSAVLGDDRRRLGPRYRRGRPLFRPLRRRKRAEQQCPGRAHHRRISRLCSSSRYSYLRYCSATRTQLYQVLTNRATYYAHPFYYKHVRRARRPHPADASQTTCPQAAGRTTSTRVPCGSTAAAKPAAAAKRPRSRLAQMSRTSTQRGADRGKSPPSGRLRLAVAFALL